jgi:hypothetical protein
MSLNESAVKDAALIWLGELSEQNAAMLKD